MPTLNFPFTNISNYTVDSDEMGIIAGKMKLALQQDDVDFTEDFADDTGHTYNSDESEFLGGQNQQKIQKPANSLLYAKWQTDENADYAIGSATGTLNGAASITGGKLSCVGEVVAFFDFSSIGQGDGSKGTAKVKWTPKYSGAAATEKHVYYNGSAIDYKGAVWLIHLGTVFYFYIYDENGNSILSESFAFSPVADTEYEIAITWDYTGVDDSNVFVDGILKCGNNILDTRGGILSIHRLGNDLTENRLADMLYDDFVVYDTVIYTENYTPGYTLPAYLYIETSDVLPEMQHQGDGTIKLFNSFSLTYSGSPRILLEIGRSGDKLYWDGDSWEVSDESYDQATDPTTFNTNCGSLPVDGEEYGQFTIVYPNSNTQSSVSELTANMNVDIGYLTTNPYGKINTGFRTDELEGFFETAIKNGSDEIKYILENNGDYYYLNGSVWTTGSLQYSNSSTASDIHTNRSTLTDSSSMWYVYFFLHSEDGTSTPELDNLQIDFSYAGETPDTLNTCLVWGYTFDAEGNPLITDTIKIRLNKYIVQYGSYSSILKNDDIEITPDDTGYWEVELIENENMTSPDGEDVNYIFDFGDTNVFEKIVPNETTKAYYELEDA